MDKEKIKMKPCFVVLEPCTPKAQLALSAELRSVINERNVLTSRSKKKLIIALDEINSTSIDKRRRSRKNQAVQEIFNSEIVYLKQLENIMTYFMKPIKSKSILTDYQYEALFGSIGTLYKVNGELLHMLKDDMMNVAAAFFKMAPFFKIYSVYAYDFKKSLYILNDLNNINSEFSKLLFNQESRPEVQAKLSSLLIMPIQRIPRYCLLLKQVLDNTLPTDSDYNTLKSSVQKLEEAARHVNSLVDEQENSQRILELSRCVKNGKTLIIQPGRRLIKEGAINRQNDTHKDKVYLILMSDIVMMCKIRKPGIAQPNGLKCAHIYPLSKCKITQNSSTKMFEIMCQDHSLVLYHDSGSESDKWIVAINDAIGRYNVNRRTLRKGSSSRRPASNKDFDAYSDVGVSPGVCRIRKRRWMEEEKDEQIVNRKVLHVDDSDENSQSCLPKRLLKRKAIHTSVRSSTSVGKDCLFPLRQQLIESQENTPGCSYNTDIVPYQPGVFMFGKENGNNSRFSFKFSNLISGIGSSFRKVFGFK